MTNITPDQLPARVSNFIAYGPEERAGDPQGSGEPITVRPQVYVRYYPAIVVQNIQEGGRSGSREGQVTVYFDPSSVGFKDPISAHMNSDDVTIPILRHSLETKTPITVAIETQRKKKNSETKAPISPLTPIHALRGASQPNGDGDGRSMMGPSGNNTSNRVAFVNGKGTQHLLSVPSEWKALVNNKTGELPPEGWRNYAVGDDWTQYGAAVRSASAPSAQRPPQQGAGGGFPSREQLGALIQEAVTQALQGFAPALVTQVAERVTQTTASAPGRPTGTFDEGKPWHPRTSDGRVNLGGSVVASERWVFEWAYKHLTEISETPVAPEEAWALSQEALAISGVVQSNAYGNDFAVNRTSASHREAEHWVQWTVANLHPFPGVDADETALDAWRGEVTQDATSFLVEAGARAGAYFQNVSKKTKNGAEAKAPAAPAQTGPAPVVVRAFLDLVQKNWDDADLIRKRGAQAREDGFLPVPVSLSVTDGVETIVYPVPDGTESVTLERLLLDRLAMLSAPAAPAQAGGPATQESPASVEATPAPQEAPKQVDPVVAGFITRLQEAKTDEDLHSIYEEIRDGNHIASQVHITPGADQSVIFVNEGDEGAMTRTLGQVLNILRENFNRTAPASPEATTATEVPAEKETPAEAPEPEPTQEQAGAEDAQALADAAPNVHTVEELNELLARIDAAGLGDTDILARGIEGKLRAWVESHRRRLQRQARG